MASTNGQFFTEQFLLPNGQPAAGVRVYHYVAGNTTTNLDVYQNGNLTNPHSNPVEGDTVGRVSFYGNGTYRLLVKSAQDDPVYPNQVLYDWDPVELVHHTATVRAEDKGLSLPSATAAARGRLFGVTDGNGDLTGLYIQTTASEWESLLSGGLLTNILQFAKGTTIASSSTITIPDNGNFFEVSGTNSIETMTGFAGYPVIFLRTLSSLTYVHHAGNLQMLGALSRTTVAGSITAFLHLGAGQWKELWYTNPFWGNGNLSDGCLLAGNAYGAIAEIGPPTVGRTIAHTGVVGSDPFWSTGLLYHGPSSCAGSLGHSGNLTISGNQALYGVQVCTNFTLNAGVTITMPTGSRRLVILATDAITINGAIHAQFVGGGGGGGIGSIGGDGTDQAGGVGGGNQAGRGGYAMVSGVPLAGSGSQLTGLHLQNAFHPILSMGSGGGGSGYYNDGIVVIGPAPGGAGGGSIVLIAPKVTLGSGSALFTFGQDSGHDGTGQLSGGGGGGGNIYVVTREYIDNGASFNTNGGTAFFQGGVTQFPGTNGMAGIVQVLSYG